VWNEPDYEVFWKGEPNAAEYLPFLRAAYQTIKSVDASAFVLMGGLAKPTDTRWFDKLLSLGGGSYTDAVNVHIYPAFATLDQTLLANRELLKRHQLQKSFWITETSSTGGYFDTQDRDAEEKHKADYLIKFYAQALCEPDVDKVFWHTLRNPGRDVHMNRDYDFGLMTGDAKPLPALTAFKNLMAHLDHAHCVGAEPAGGYVFQREQQTTRILWRNRAPAHIETVNNAH
jgi:Glycosyl hydrolase catalytic core